MTSNAMSTFIITVSYDGTAYVGWQVQINGPTIQSTIEKALAQITGERIRLTGSGRTDSGVHALGQVASFVCDLNMSCRQWLRALNGRLPTDIRVLSVQRLERVFDPIREAVGKRYRYVVHDEPLQDVFARNTAWHVRTKLDVACMQRTAQVLIGQHDFRSFQAAGSPRATTIRHVRELLVARSPHHEAEVCVEIEANGFLYRMVRNIVGVLVDVGHGEIHASELERILDARDRRLARRTAPPHGLYLLRVEYPPLNPCDMATCSDL